MYNIYGLVGNNSSSWYQDTNHQSEHAPQLHRIWNSSAFRWIDNEIIPSNVSFEWFECNT